MKKNIDKFFPLIKKIMSYLLLILFGIILLMENNLFFAFLFFLIVIYLLSNKYKFKRFSICLFTIAFIIRLLIILLVKTPIMSDFAVMYNTAMNILNNDFSYVVNSSYMNTWGYQMGHTMYLYFLLKIFNNVTFLKVINCLITACITVLIYLISKEFSSEKSSRIISLVYCFFPFPMFLNTVLTNQHLPSLLILISIYLIVGKRFSNINHIIKYIIIGLLLGMSNVLRPESIVFILCLIIYFILSTNKNNIKSTMIKTLVLLITYFGIFNCCSYALKVNGYSDIGLKNKNFLWKFVVGLNHEANGRYNNADALKYSSVGNDEEKIELIKERLIDDAGDLPRLFLVKSAILWSNSDLSWSLYYLDGKDVNIFGYVMDGTILKNKLTTLNQYFITLSLLLMIIGGATNYRDKIDNNKSLLIMIILVYFSVYLLTEVMPRYAYTPQLFIFILASIGLDKVISRINKNFKYQ